MGQHATWSRILVSAVLTFASPVTAADLPADQVAFFESRIRPILVEHCYGCHNSSKEAAGSLALDHRTALLRGGAGGAIIVPGRPDQSRLPAILRHEVAGLKMPQGGARFAAGTVRDFERWIAMGAPDPRDHPPTADELTRATSWEATFTKRKQWWSFQPVTAVAPPDFADHNWPTHPIDRFLQASLKTRGLAPVGRASRPALLRRVSFVLTGLPPTPAEIQRFIEDTSDDAYESLIDRLLNSSRFGERWARHWMDLVRYCESHGSQGDPELANAYRYRDYLIRAFNQDLPYNQLVREHIAGDLLTEPRWNPAGQFNESAIGPAHLRMVELGFVPVDALEDQVKVVDNQIDVYSKAFLGLTASCARCHNHKFDPISQEDFYALYGIFVSGRPGQVLIDSPELLNRHRAELTSLKRQIRDGLAAAWLKATSNMGLRLHAERGRAERLAALRLRLKHNTQSIAAIEQPARKAVLHRRRNPETPREGTAGNRPLSQIQPGPPVPYARWSFDGDATDSVGNHHGQLFDGAVVESGRLILDGRRSSMRTSPLDRDLREKTLEAWVSLDNLTQRGIGVIGLDTPGDRTFDSIVFGEQTPQHWMAGSDYFRRTRPAQGTAETSLPGQLIHTAIVYSKDNSITLYRNGRPYGKPYTRGVLQPFLKGKSRFLFGQRLTGVNPPLAGGIEEARAYARALSAAEIAASYEAGPDGIRLETLLAILTPQQRRQLIALHATRRELLAERQQLDPSVGEGADPWAKAFEDAGSNRNNPLHVWTQYMQASATGDESLPGRWKALADYWQDTLQARRESSDSEKFRTVWDLRTRTDDWSGNGTGFADQLVIPERTGTFRIEPDGERVVTGIHDAGVFSHSLSNRHTGVLSSPRFVIDSDFISVRAFGKNARVRLVIENYPRGNGGIYPAATLNGDQFEWVVLNSSYRKGQRACLQIETELTERAGFAIGHVVTSDTPQAPLERTAPIALLLRSSAPDSLDRLATSYTKTLKQSIVNWQTDSLDADGLAFLNFFIRNNLLPTTMSALPGLREPIKRYRELEQQIPMPRRAPGMLETSGYDQPLFERGQHTHPGVPIPRRGLSLFDSTPFDTHGSGRLQLAEQTASAVNPLTARVLVNRLWHHVFGQGLVRTVDNFGHLGDRPSHPELLDYLAAKFVTDGWSIKTLLRFLVTSRAFQQSSRPGEDALRIDPGNRYLSHMSLRRLDADAIRDSILATSGQLDFRMSGPGVNVYYSSKTEGGGPKGPLDGDRRRSVYLRIRRNAHNPFLEAFDAPKPAGTRGRRDITNVPAQSLTMLNDPFVIDQASKWSKLMIATHADHTRRVQMMYRRAFTREPTAEEIQVTLDYVTQLQREHIAVSDDAARQQLVWQDVAHTIFCLKEFIHVE